MQADPGDGRILRREDLSTLFAALTDSGYTIVGPTLREGAIVYDEITDPADLPVGWTDTQAPGRYRLERRTDDALFGYNVGPHSWKRYLHVPWLHLWRARREADGFVTETSEASPPRLALLGVRACELHAIAIQDRVLLGGPHRDPDYARRRAAVLVIAVNCTQAGGTCFCTSMGTGPRVRAPGFDLAITELLQEGRHELLVDVGSPSGAAVMAKVPTAPCTPDRRTAAAGAIARAEGQMGRQLDRERIKELLYDNLEHPRWDEVATRCLGCANCTMVCPTCFCTSIDDVTDLGGDHAERVRRWDSCFSTDFAHLSGGSTRTSLRARYRQWLVHKLGSWIDQFGTSGCVGCGRCITWCPVGIDITEEVAAIRATAGAPSAPAAPSTPRADPRDPEGAHGENRS